MGRCRLDTVLLDERKFESKVIDSSKVSIQSWAIVITLVVVETLVGLCKASALKFHDLHKLKTHSIFKTLISPCHLVGVRLQS